MIEASSNVRNFRTRALVLALALTPLLWAGVAAQTTLNCGLGIGRPCPDPQGELLERMPAPRLAPTKIGTDRTVPLPQPRPYTYLPPETQPTEEEKQEAWRSVQGELPSVKSLPHLPVRKVVGIPDGLRGGLLSHHDAGFRQIRDSGADVEVRGWCASGCTVVMVHIPKHRLCFADDASLAYHMSRIPPEGIIYDTSGGGMRAGHENFRRSTPSPDGVKWIYDWSPADIKAWIDAKGGYTQMPIDGYWALTAPELWEMGYQRCDSKPPRAPYINPTRSWELVPD